MQFFKTQNLVAFSSKTVLEDFTRAKINFSIPELRSRRLNYLIHC